MKIIDRENVSEAVAAMAHFLALFFRIIRDKEIFNSQTAYIPPEFDWVKFIDCKIQEDIYYEVDLELLRLGAAIATISRLDDLFNEDLQEDRFYQELIDSLKGSEFYLKVGFFEFFKAQEIAGNYIAVSDALRIIYKEHVEKWWARQLTHGWRPPEPHWQDDSSFTCQTQMIPTKSK